MWLIICGAIFTLLQNMTPHDIKQPNVRKDAYLDVIYWISSPFVYSGVSVGMLTFGLWAIFGGNMEAAQTYANKGAVWAQNMPLWLLAILALVFTDFSLYWTHRLFHRSFLWKFHAVHHGAQDMDWMHSVRFHPVNVVCHGIFANSLAIWIGFPPAAIAVLVPFNILYSGMVHANLNWTFGPLKYVFASPVFHRWHHTGPDEGGNMNFAATFPFLDVMFGTFYWPETKRPGPTGVWEDYVPKDLLGQLLFPFIGETREEEEAHKANIAAE